ncbi:conserved hypothetical protein [uncultured Eubacteriales bacterium]|uniref:Uncharacterized protein n=1 Tax=uncultured Eubacteriales bacterium TaxID=172733 RepID=A0A212J4I2_9FIRM|nr:conserved hypothetical protein [uncultured Eubacteriales bacterium]
MTREERFFGLIQETAAEQGKKFFVSCGEGHELNTEELEGEDFSGWMIPLDRAEAFFEDWKSEDADALDTWEEFFTFAEWVEESGTIKITFQTH